MTPTPTSFAQSSTGAPAATYTCDAAGNLDAKTVGGTTTTYSHDAENRLTGAVSGSEVTAFTSDLYGRRTAGVSSTEGATTYTWDPLGHLVCVASAESTLTYQYGPTGMREEITVVTPEATRTTQCAYDGQALLSEHDSDGTTYRYLWGPDRTPLALEVSRPGRAASVYTYHTDAAGSVVALTDAAGLVVAEYRYDAFGGVAFAGGTDPALASRNPIRYRSYYYDTATALYYLPARYYEPETARFLSPDPAPPSAGDPLSLNAYCQGDPVNAEDPSGAVADIWREHPNGVDVGVAVHRVFEGRKRQARRVSYGQAQALVLGERLARIGSIRPTLRYDGRNWVKPWDYDRYRMEWLRENDRREYNKTRGKYSLDVSPSSPDDLMLFGIGAACDFTDAAVTAVATAGGTTGGAGVVVVAGRFAYGGMVVTAVQIGDALGGYFFEDDTLGDLLTGLFGPDVMVFLNYEPSED